MITKFVLRNGSICDKEEVLRKNILFEIKSFIEPFLVKQKNHVFYRKGAILIEGTIMKNQNLKQLYFHFGSEMNILCLFCISLILFLMKRDMKQICLKPWCKSYRPDKNKVTN